MSASLEVLVLLAILGSGLVAGLLFIFSNTVIAALHSLGAEQGAGAMNAINRVILNPVFFLVFMGTGAVSLAVAFFSFRLAGPERAYLLGASALYLIGVVLVTGIVNVPLNDRLAAAELGTQEAKTLWEHYCRRWTWWNHVRTVAALVATGLFAMAL